MFLESLPYVIVPHPWAIVPHGIYLFPASSLDSLCGLYLCQILTKSSKAVHEQFTNHENFGKNAILEYLAVQINICKIYWKMRLLLRYLLLCYVRNVLSLYKL